MDCGTLIGSEVGVGGVGRKLLFLGGIERHVRIPGQGDVVEVCPQACLEPVGECVHGVGDQLGVVTGRDRLAVGAGVGELFGGHLEQVTRCPLLRVSGADGRDQSRPGRIRDDGFGQHGSEHGIDIGDPGGA